MSAEERLIRYCQIDTQSDPANEEETPSSKKQFDLARVLEAELKELGLEDVTLDEHCYVYAKLPSNNEREVKTVGFVAHMDTAPDFSGTNVKPRIIENFDGNDIALNEEVTLKMDDFPWMRDLKGKRLMVTDGSTLLGADDKAGITCIMEALVYLKEHPEIKAAASQIPWQLDDDFKEMLPIMQTDIMLSSGGKTLIIDAKYYEHSLQKQYDSYSVHSGNLYQIFTYVKNKEVELKNQEHESVSGMLLYAKTDEVVYPDHEYKMSGNTIAVRTLDLDSDFAAIKNQLDYIVEKYL